MTSPILKIVGEFFNQNIKILILLTILFYLFTFSYDVLPFRNGYSYNWFIICYIYGYVLRSHFSFPCQINSSPTIHKKIKIQNIVK